MIIYCNAAADESLWVKSGGYLQIVVYEYTL